MTKYEYRDCITAAIIGAAVALRAHDRFRDGGLCTAEDMRRFDEQAKALADAWLAAQKEGVE